MNILALDLATKTGWAHSCGDSGVWDLSVKRDESGGMRFIRLRGKLVEVRDGPNVDVVVYESPIYMPKMRSGFEVGAKLLAIVEAWCIDWNIQYRGYKPSEIKKHATGKGNAKKDVMVAAAKEKWNREFADDNEADACWLLDLAQKDLMT